MNIHQALVRGDLEQLRKLLGNPADFPNSHNSQGVAGIILESAIYSSPINFIRDLLQLGADPNYDDPAGFPSLIAAVSTERADRYGIVELLLSHGADTAQRGINDWTPLHYAAVKRDSKIYELLLSHGANPSARTRIDNYATPLEEAELVWRAGELQDAQLQKKK